MRIYSVLAFVALAGYVSAGVRRADCHNGHQCVCSDGQTGVCNSQGHCDCGNNGKRQAASQCTTAADCTGCSSNQVAECHHGHCTCHHDSNHHPFRRADCHNGHQCVCSDGQTGVCNSQGHCDCGNNGKRQAASQCTTAADCTGCSSNQVAECHHGHCTCHHDSNHHPFRQVRQTMCTVDANCTCAGAHEVAFCENGNCHCKHDEHHHNPGNHHPGRRQTTACMDPDDCTCGAHETATCDAGMCHCHNDGDTGNHNPPHHPQIRQTMCTVDANCTCAGAHEVAFCENGNCHCKHDEHHHNPGNHHPGRRQTTACMDPDDCTCGAHETATCDAGMCHCHNNGDTGNHNPPHHP